MRLRSRASSSAGSCRRSEPDEPPSWIPSCPDGATLTITELSAIALKNCEVFFRSLGNKYVIPASEIFSIQFEDTKNKVYTKYINLPEGENKCLNGQMDAENYHGKKGGHFALGFLFGPFAMVGTLLASPTPEKGKRTYLMSKNKEQFTDYEYIKCYKKKAKAQLIGMEAAGWGSYLIILLLAGSGV